MSGMRAYSSPAARHRPSSRHGPAGVRLVSHSRPFTVAQKPRMRRLRGLANRRPEIATFEFPRTACHRLETGLELGARQNGDRVAPKGEQKAWNPEAGPAEPQFPPSDETAFNRGG